MKKQKQNKLNEITDGEKLAIMHINKMNTIYNKIISLFQEENISISDALYLLKKCEIGVLEIEKNILKEMIEKQKKDDNRKGMYG